MNLKQEITPPRTQRLVQVIWFCLALCLIFISCRPVNVPTPASTSTPEQIPVATVPPKPQEPVGLKISQIQGAQHRSPLDGKTVENVLGVVTALKGTGFYMQDPEPDGDPKTSEGIFVVMRSYKRLAVGDLVRVEKGKVTEVNPAGVGANSLTSTVLEATQLSVQANKQVLPEPVVLGKGGRAIPNQIIEDDVRGYMGQNRGLFDPEQDGIDFYESLEGMRVEVRDAIAVSSSNAYREVAIVADRGENAGIFASSGAIVLRPDDPNPERIILDDAFIRMPELRVGSKFTQPIIGIIEYAFGNFKLSPTQKIIFTPAEPLELPDLPSPTDDLISVATYNIENLSPERHPQEHQAIASQIVSELGSPDILALQEILDDDGAIDSGRTEAGQNIALLTQAIREAGGPDYAAMNIDPIDNLDGGITGGNIRSIILYRTDRGLRPLPGIPGDAQTDPQVTGQGAGTRLDRNPARLGNQLSSFRASRKPLIAGFTYKGQTLYVVSVHFKSKSEDGPLFGDQQPPQQVTARQRIGQAEGLAAFTEKLLAADPKAKLILAGDFNDFPWAESLAPLAQSGLYNLAQEVPENERYSYNHEGNAQMLDQIWVSPALRQNLTWFQVMHLNSLQIASIQASDHDPLLAYFSLEQP